ncbi:MAG: hypothetical protein R6X02_10730 [Enhygromyxa sp.]
MARSYSRLIIVASLLLAACNDDGSSNDAAETGDAGDTGDTGGDQLPGPAEGWESSFVADGVAFRCSASEDEIIAAGAPSLSFADTTLYVGAEQNNQGQQDAIIARFDGGVMAYCVEHESDGPNGIGLGLTWDGGPTAYVVYAIHAAGSGFEKLGGWLSEYAPGPISGAGAQATVLGRVEVETGALERATFVIAVTEEQKVADHPATAAPRVLADGSVELLGSAEQAPIDADAATAMDCQTPPHSTRYVFSDDLAQLVCASASGCTPQQPCP